MRREFVVAAPVLGRSNVRSSKRLGILHAHWSVRAWCGRDGRTPL